MDTQKVGVLGRFWFAQEGSGSFRIRRNSAGVPVWIRPLASTEGHCLKKRPCNAELGGFGGDAASVMPQSFLHTAARSGMAQSKAVSASL